MAIAAATAEAPLDDPADGVRLGPPAPPLPSAASPLPSGSPLPPPAGLALTAIELLREIGRPPAIEFCNEQWDFEVNLRYKMTQTRGKELWYVVTVLFSFIRRQKRQT